MFLTLIWKKSPVKHLTKISFNSTPGRAGRILTRHKSVPLNKRRLRLVNTKPFLVTDTAQVLRIEYNPAQSAFVALVRFLKGGFLSYSPVSSSAQVGDLIYINPPLKKISSTGGVVLNSNKRADVIAPLYKFPKGAVLSNVSARPFGVFSLCRSAGVRAKIIAFSANKKIVELLMPSGKVVYLSSTCFAMSGSSSNSGHFLFKKTKAGQSYFKGVRPTVRGVAMNPVDHPMGGGEGKSSGGRPSVSPWGKLTKGGFRTISKEKKINAFNIKNTFLK